MTCHPYISAGVPPFDKQCRWRKHDDEIGLPSNTVIFRMASSGMSRRVTLVRTDISEELSGPSIITVIRICELGTLAVTSPSILKTEAI
jgi:hypothetical protein